MLKKLTAILILSLFTAGPAFAAELSVDALAGKWNFKYWAEKSSPDKKYPVNRIMEFKTDGSIINYGKHEQDKADTAKFEIRGDTIIYSDKRGKQNWKLLSLTETELHVDHHGALMFLEKQS